jgi:Dna[CI] antecedent, DciA
MKKKNDVTLAEAMQQMLQEFRLQPQMHETRIKMLWEKLMGNTIATYTSNISVRKNVLYVSILSAPLKNELIFGKDKIVALINEELGEQYIREVVIR